MEVNTFKPLTAPVWYAMERTRNSHMSWKAQIVAELEHSGLVRGHHKTGEETLLLEGVTESQRCCSLS